MPKILIVEDDVKLGQMLARYLKSQLHIVDFVEGGVDALALLNEYTYDLIILDILLPDLDGLTVCRQYRESGGQASILALTGRTTVPEREEGLDAGADDYLTKPFDVRELGARVRALLRRGRLLTSQALSLGELTIDVKGRTVVRCGVELELAPKEFALLEFFMRNPNQVFSADALLDRVWRSDADTSIGSVRVYINRLRAKLGVVAGCPSVETVYGVGYKLLYP